MTNTTTRPASDRQYSFLTTLINEREGHGVTDAAVFVAQLRQANATTAQISPMIDAMTKLPRKAAPASGPTNGARRNTYAGKCAKCGSWVAEQCGGIQARTDGRKGFDPVHFEGECITGATPVAALAEGVYEKDGLVYRVKLSKGGNLYAQRAIVIPGEKLEWEYLGAKGLGLVAGAIAITAETAARIGYLTSACIVCSRVLDLRTSIAAGYGAKCASNHGWHYPTAEEAEAILSERGL